jgi:RimJ/RimL family protein N-acetyltransferase
MGQRDNAIFTGRMMGQRLACDYHTERLWLHSYPLDIDAHIRWLNDKGLMKYSEQRHHTHTRFSQIKYIASFDHDNSFLWEIALRPIPNPVGTITAYCDWNNKTADLGILIGEMGGRGYGTEAWSAVCRELFASGIRKVTGGCMMCNEAMIRVFQKTGMTPDGHRADQFLLDGKPMHAVYYARFA